MGAGRTLRPGPPPTAWGRAGYVRPAQQVHHGLVEGKEA